MTEAPGVLDYSFAHPTLSAFPPSVKGVARYLRGTGLKPLTAAEAGEIHAAGYFIVVNDETTSGDAANGGSAGQAAGAAAGAAARALGIPTSCVIHPSVDFDVTSSKQMGAVEQYISAYHQASGYGQGVYGEADVLDAVGGTGLLTTGMGWQSSAWSGGRISSRAALYQYLNGQTVGGAAVDFNRLINLDGLGVWTLTSPSADAAAVFAYPLPMPGGAAPQPFSGQWGEAFIHLRTLTDPAFLAPITTALNSLQNAINMLSEQVSQIPAAGGSTDPAGITAAVTAGVQAALAALEVNVGTVTNFTPKGSS